MPELSRFYGIVITMYYQSSEHNPPHIHARYGDHVAEFDIHSGEVIEGKIPPKAQSLVKEWILIHNTELNEIWRTQIFKKINPLE